MTDTPSAFKYSPLVGKDSIRLLVIQPGQPGSDIHCDLIHTTLAECHDNVFDHYTALSYVWGDQTNKRTIFVNDIAFEVTSNLFDALDDIRDEHRSPRLWADAICINQTDFAERSSQVALMRQIYSFASFTIIYLGKSNDDCDGAIRAIHRSKFEDHHGVVLNAQILTRPWFSRVWVYQELVLSRAPVIQVGRDRVRWDALHATVFGDDQKKRSRKLKHGSSVTRQIGHRQIYDGTKRLLPNKHSKAVQRFHSMHMARDQENGSPSLISILPSRRGLGATDKRDFIFGHLAIADLPAKAIVNGEQCPIVDYQRSTVDVFTDAAVFMLSERAHGQYSYRHYECLLYVDSLMPRMTGLPSWVPDWSSISGYSAEIPSVVVKYEYNPMNAMKLFWYREKTQSAEFPKPGLCVVRLLRVGKIQWINNSSPGDFNFAQDMEENIKSKSKSRDGVVNNLINYSNVDAVIGFSPGQATTLLSELFFQLRSDLPDILIGRRVATITKSAHICLVPDKTEVDDVIYCLPHGLAETEWGFLVLRPMLNFPGMAKLERDFKDSDAPGRVTDDERHFTIVGRGLVEDTAIMSWSPTKENIYPGLCFTRDNMGHNITLH